MKLPNNFKCADVICDFCGYLAQVKTVRVRNVESVPNAVLGAVWGPKKDRMAAAIYFPLFLVLIGVSKTAYEDNSSCWPSFGAYRCFPIFGIPAPPSPPKTGRCFLLAQATASHPSRAAAA